MELKLYANRNPEENINMQISEFKRIMERNYSRSPMQRFHETFKATLLFPFEFIIIVLWILMLPLITLASALGVRNK